MKWKKASKKGRKEGRKGRKGETEGSEEGGRKEGRRKGRGKGGGKRGKEGKKMENNQIHVFFAFSDDWDRKVICSFNTGEYMIVTKQYLLHCCLHQVQ